MLVATTHFRPGIPLKFLPGAASKILCCCYGGKELYSGTTIILPTASPSFLHSSLICWQAYSISSSPVKKSRMSPSASSLWILTTVSIEALR